MNARILFPLFALGLIACGSSDSNKSGNTAGESGRSGTSGGTSGSGTSAGTSASAGNGGTGNGGTAGTRASGGAGGTTGGSAGTGPASGGTSGSSGNPASGGNGASAGTSAPAGGASGAAGTGTPTGAGSVLQHHNDAARTGLYVDAAFTAQAAAGVAIDASFANAAYTGDKVYAQPLYLAGADGTPDQVIVATERNQVYAFNAATGAQTWTTPLGTPVTSGLPCGNIAGNGNSLGVTGTPVIDGVSRTIYLDAMTADAQATAKHMVHALNADTGAELTGWPVDIDATATSSNAMFDSVVQNQRGGLALLGGKVFVSYSGHPGDCQGYHGWIVGIDTTSRQATAWASRAIGGGMWGASGIASDGTSLFVATGNSKSSASAGPNSSSGDNNGMWGDSETVYKFPTNVTPPPATATTDYFLPSNWIDLDDADQDMGGTSPILVDVPGATPSKLLVDLGKDSNAYLLDRDNLGGMDATPIAKLKVSSGQIINAMTSYRTATATYVVFKGAGSGCPMGQSGGLTAFKINAASPPTLAMAWCGGPSSTGSPASTVTDAAGTDAIVWAVGSDNKLHGLNGDTGASVYDGGATAMSAVQTIQTPIVANGRIFVASNTQVYAFKP